MSNEEIGGKGWRPTEVHPLAALFPPLADDDLAILAADIKANGLIHPIVIDDTGQVIDGRMRLAACEKAGVEPRYEALNGRDAATFIWSANAKRRKMTKGQVAMIAAEGLSFEAKKSTGGRPDEGKAKAAKAAGVSASRFAQALTVKDHASHLVADVIAGLVSLDDAYRQALEHKRQHDRLHHGMNTLRQEDKELWQKVIDAEISLDEAFEEIDKRKRAIHAMRDSVFMGMTSLLASAAGFDKSSALQELAKQLNDDEADAHLRQYFKGGKKEVAERLKAARTGLEALEAVWARVCRKRGD